MSERRVSETDMFCATRILPPPLLHAYKSCLDELQPCLSIPRHLADLEPLPLVGQLHGKAQVSGALILKSPFEPARSDLKFSLHRDSARPVSLKAKCAGLDVEEHQGYRVVSRERCLAGVHFVPADPFDEQDLAAKPPLNRFS